jgi:hypothetical protein
MPENIDAKNNLSYTSGNIFNINESDILPNNKPGSVITENVSKNVHVLTSADKNENITAMACCNAADQLLFLILIFMDVYEKQDFGDGLPPGSDMYMNQNSSYFSTDLYIKRFTEYSLKPKASGKVILLLHDHRCHCSSSLLLQTAVQSNVTIILLQPLDKQFFGPLELFQKKKPQKLQFVKLFLIAW